MAALAQRTISTGTQRAQAPSRRAVRVQAATRPLWLPGAQVPAHLTGKLPGDFGFDPLELGKDPRALNWYQQAELVHARTAMTAVAGILFVSIGAKLGAGFPAWYDAGKVYIERPGAIPFSTLLVVQFFLYGFVEMKRYQDIVKPGSQAEKGSFLGFESAFGGTGENGYPGGLFDPMGLSRQGAEQLAQYKLKEIKNGRLAMLASLGFAAQYAATGKGPIDNLIDHVSSPWTTTFADNGVSVPFL